MTQDFDEDAESAERAPEDMKREYVLPDGREISVTAERFRVPELLFKPEALGYFEGKENIGLAHRIVHAVQGCAEAIQV